MPPHPAKFSDSVLEYGAHYILPGWTVLDPFAGVGRIHEISKASTWGVEIEPEWAHMHPRTIVGNALCLPFRSDSFDAIFTSPCVEISERVLTADLRWIAAGDVRENDKLLAFDEESPFVKANGHAARRKWRIATVTQAGIATKECVRVTLENGDSVVCSTDHPWLVSRYAYTGNSSSWVQAKDLMGSGPTGRGKLGSRQPYYALKQLVPWEPDRSYEAGWLAGMFDGEGSLSFGVHGSPKLMICQNLGAVADQTEEWLRTLGFKVNIIHRTGGKMVNIYVIDGWPGLLTALGKLRPLRLLQKLETLNVHSRTIEPWRVKVVSVEPVGPQQVATITTSTGTYITEGYLHHNTYGNRMADHHVAKEKCKTCEGEGVVAANFGISSSGVPAIEECPRCGGAGFNDYKRLTYRHQLGRALHPDNSGQLQWGVKYQNFHSAAWEESIRVLKPGGIFILNVSDHIRAGQIQPVSLWHKHFFIAHPGMKYEGLLEVPTPRMRFGANHSLRVDNELILIFSKKRLRIPWYRVSIDLAEPPATAGSHPQGDSMSDTSVVDTASAEAPEVTDGTDAAGAEVVGTAENDAPIKERRPRGWLETDVKKITDQFVTGEVKVPEGQHLTPHRISRLVQDLDSLPQPPSTGAVAAVLNRWVELGFIQTNDKPFAFLDYTQEGREQGLSALKAQRAATRKQNRAAAKAASASDETESGETSPDSGETS